MRVFRCLLFVYLYIPVGVFFSFFFSVCVCLFVVIRDRYTVHQRTSAVTQPLLGITPARKVERVCLLTRHDCCGLVHAPPWLLIFVATTAAAATALFMIILIVLTTCLILWGLLPVYHI